MRTYLAAAATIATCVLLAPRAGRAASNVVDTTISDEVMETIIHRVLERNPIPPFAKGCANASGTCWLDHVDFNDDNGLQLERGPSVLFTPILGAPVLVPIVRVKVPSTIYWKTNACVDDPSCPLQTYDEVQNTTTYIDISLQGSQLCGELSGIGAPGLNIPNPPPPAQCFSLDLGVSGLSEDYAIAFRGITVDSGANQVVLRQEFQPTSQPWSFSQSAWQAFYDGAVPGIGGQEASVYIGRKMIMDAISDKFRDGVIDEPGIYWEPGFEQTWTAAGNAAIIDMVMPVSVDTEVLVGVPCVMGNVPADIHATVTIALDPVGNQLVADVTASAEINAAYVGVCFLGPDVMSHFNSAALAAVVAALNFTPEESPSISDCNEVGPLHYQCPTSLTSSLSLPSEFPGSTVSLNFVSLAADGDGIHLEIDATPPLPLGDSLNASVVNPSYGIRGGCSNLRIGYEGTLFIMGINRVFEIEIDQSTAAGWTVPGTDSKLAPIILPVAANPEAYPQMKDLRVTLFTSSGLQSVLLEAPSPVTAAQKWLTYLHLVGVQQQCLRWEEEMMLRYDPRWDIDPPHHGIVEVMTPDLRTLYGYAMLVEVDLEVRNGAWINGTLLVDVGQEELESIDLRVLALTAEEAEGMTEDQIAEMIRENGLAELIELPADLMGVPDAVAVFELGAPYEDELIPPEM